MTRPTRPACLALCALLPALAAPAAAEEVALREGLGLAGGGGRTARAAVASDPVLERVVAGTWAFPKAGDDAGGGRAWQAVEADAEGRFRGPAFRGGYAAFRVESDRPRPMIFEAAGHAWARFNGEPRAGDPYGYGYVRLPVWLREGENAILVRGGRGEFRGRLVDPPAPASLDPVDATLPDLVVGEPVDALGAVVLINATENTLAGHRLRATLPGEEAETVDLPPIPPLSTRKVAFRLAGRAPASAGPVAAALAVLGPGGEEVHAVDVALEAKPPEAARRRTFVSEVDGSVQYFAEVAAAPGPGGPRPGLILTLHGASVEAIGQAACYAPRDWAHVVAPTNRRPYGFDWEDWGRLDALEVLDLNLRRLDPDPARVYLTGHSMGGHGTWHVGVTHPDRFAAIAPSAGWVSMFSYAGLRSETPDDPAAALVRRGASPSDTLALAKNLEGLGVYVLHGDRDDNVPVGQARRMRSALAEFHPDFAYYERPGAGHWWGNECVDWPELMQFLRARTRPEPASLRKVAFRTASPAVSSRHFWAEVEAQARPFEVSSIELERTEDGRRLAGTTENVSRLAIDPAGWDASETLEVSLDGGDSFATPRPASGRIFLARGADGAWSTAAPLDPAREKTPARMGPFKLGFRHRVAFVYATGGDPESAAWARARARFDAESFWYRGNASVDVVADVDFDPAADPDRSVVLYGDAEGHACWSALLPGCPVEVRPGRVSVGSRVLEGDDLACLFVRPRPGSERATVAVVSGTGPAGRRRTETLPYFTSGVAYPDCLVVGPGDPSIRLAGYFGPDWGVDSGEFAGGRPD